MSFWMIICRRLVNNLIQVFSVAKCYQSFITFRLAQMGNKILEGTKNDGSIDKAR